MTEPEIKNAAMRIAEMRGGLSKRRDYWNDGGKLAADNRQKIRRRMNDLAMEREIENANS